MWGLTQQFLKGQENKVLIKENECGKDCEACLFSTQSADKHVLFFQGKEALSTPCPLVNYFLTVGPGRLGRCIHHRPPTACRTEGQARKQLQEKVFSSHFHSPFLGLQTTGKQMGGK